MNWLKRIFGGRSKLSASGSLHRTHLLNVAAGTAAGFRHYGVKAEVATVSNTNSMLPTFDENALLILEDVPFSDLSEGDIVTRRISTLLPFTVHRLNERTSSGWQHLGDNNARADSVPVTPENYHRRVTAIFYGPKGPNTDL